MRESKPSRIPAGNHNVGGVSGSIAGNHIIYRFAAQFDIGLDGVISGVRAE